MSARAYEVTIKMHFAMFGLLLLYLFLSLVSWEISPRGLVWIDNKPYTITKTSTYGGYAYPAGKPNEDPLEKVLIKPW